MSTEELEDLLHDFLKKSSSRSHLGGHSRETQGVVGNSGGDGAGAADRRSTSPAACVCDVFLGAFVHTEAQPLAAPGRAAWAGVW